MASGSVLAPLNCNRGNAHHEKARGDPNRTAKRISAFHRDVRKSDFGLAGQIEPRVAIANSLRLLHTEKLAFLPNP